MFDSSNSEIFSYLAPAKINLCLKIGQKQQNGYHELASVIGFAEFGDTVKIEFYSEDLLLMTGDFSAKIPVNTHENLVMKSINALRGLKYNIPPLKITIEKKIPVGGGLGGGSSDAATVFLALNEIFKLNMSKTQLEKIAIEIGADVPVCLNRNFVIMRGIGDYITPLKTHDIPQYIVIASPGTMANTRSVFKEFDNNKVNKESENMLKEFNIEKFLSVGNDLEHSAKKLYPKIGILLDIMKATYPKNHISTPFIVQMSGSGSCCFALFEDAMSSKLFCHKINKAGYWSVSSKFISEF